MLNTVLDIVGKYMNYIIISQEVDSKIRILNISLQQAFKE